MREDSKRLNGWKSIGAYFGRDRTTAIRWARERGLPVHRTPGGKISTVYAFAAELDQWLTANEKITEFRGSRGKPAGSKPGKWFSRAIAGSVGVLVVTSGPAAHYLRSSAVPEQSTATTEILPDDPQTAALYLRARENWARRETKRIDAAIEGFAAVIARDPSYAPAYAGLADAYILAREFGSVPDHVAFPKAKAAASVALRLEPDLVGARRALGFVQYWWEHNRAAAGASFRQALELAPADPQTHFWYGNALADNGDFAAAIRELNKARALNPESIAIQNDWAWAMWSAGDRETAVPILIQLARTHPRFAAPHDCLRDIYLAERDYPHYLDELSILAELRGEALLQRRAVAERRAFVEGGVRRLEQLILAHAMMDRNRPVGNIVWPAFVASATGNRVTLVQLLDQADMRKEAWGEAGQRAQIASRWRDDQEIMRLLARREPQPME